MQPCYSMMQFKCLVFLTAVLLASSSDVVQSLRNTHQRLEELVLQLQKELEHQKHVQVEMTKQIDLQREKIQGLEAIIEKENPPIPEQTTLPSHDPVLQLRQSRIASKRALTIGRPVAFSAILRTTLYNIARGSVVNFDNITVNDGGAYNNGIFCVPQSGVYYFSWNFIAETGYSATLGLYVNGMIVRYSYSDSSQRPIMAGNNAILRLNPGDRVWLGTYLDNAVIHHNLSAFSAFWIAD